MSSPTCPRWASAGGPSLQTDDAERDQDAHGPKLADPQTRWLLHRDGQGRRGEEHAAGHVAENARRLLHAVPSGRRSARSRDGGRRKIGLWSAAPADVRLGRQELLDSGHDLAHRTSPSWPKMSQDRWTPARSRSASKGRSRTNVRGAVESGTGVAAGPRHALWSCLSATLVCYGRSCGMLRPVGLLGAGLARYRGRVPVHVRVMHAAPVATRYTVNVPYGPSSTAFSAAADRCPMPPCVAARTSRTPSESCRVSRPMSVVTSASGDLVVGPVLAAPGKCREAGGAGRPVAGDGGLRPLLEIDRRIVSVVQIGSQAAARLHAGRRRSPRPGVAALSP